MYESEAGETIVTNQYSAYEFYSSTDMKQDHFRLPGVFFFYDFYPMRIKVTQQPKNFAKFVVRICAIIGGIYVILGLANMILLRILERKNSF